MLTPSNILVLDEATAAVDVQTDAALQATLRGPLFAHRTIITVAHRINTIMDSDRVVVLEKGEVAEYGEPRELVARGGLFAGLVRQAGIGGDGEAGPSGSGSGSGSGNGSGGGNANGSGSESLVSTS
jgi:ATP-binding cassette subfamily C (CFTR/MRP) protein 1